MACVSVVLFFPSFVVAVDDALSEVVRDLVFEVVRRVVEISVLEVIEVVSVATSLAVVVVVARLSRNCNNPNMTMQYSACASLTEIRGLPQAL